MIYTSYFANLKNIVNEDSICAIAICGKSPDNWSGLEYKKLAPKYSFFKTWKENKDNTFYVRHYLDEVLGVQDVHQVVKELYSMANGKDPLLLCYEKRTEFCHRHLVSSWFRSNGYQSKELI